MDTRTWFLGLLGLVGLVRVGEAVVSWRRLRWREATSERVLFPVMVALHVGLVVGPGLEVVGWERVFEPWVGGLAAIVLVGATGLRVWTLRALGRAWNVRVVAPGEVVTRGPYRWIRHPNYLVVILEIAALPLLHSAWVSAGVLSALNAAVLWRRIRTEEAVLRELPEWRAAMEGKARLIPGLL